MNWRLYLDIGNFAVKYGVRTGGEWVAVDALEHAFGYVDDEVEELTEAQEYVHEMVEEIQSALEEAELASADCSGIVVSCTTEGATNFILTLANVFHCPLRQVGLDLRPKIKTEYHDPSQIGADRLANATAAAALYGCPVVVVDCGTCLTSEIVNAQGVFIGGNIGAGMPLLSFGLMGLSEQLRQAMEAGTGTMPEHIVGRSTMEAIYGGLALQLAGTADRFVDEALLELGLEEVTTVLTGGDAELCGQFMGLPTQVNSLLTLEGLRLLDGFD